MLHYFHKIPLKASSGMQSFIKKTFMNAIRDNLVEIKERTRRNKEENGLQLWYNFDATSLQDRSRAMV